MRLACALGSQLLAAFLSYLFFFFNRAATTEIYTLSLHDALPISCADVDAFAAVRFAVGTGFLLVAGVSDEEEPRSEEHTSELQSRFDLVCRLLLEKKKQRLLPSLPRSKDLEQNDRGRLQLECMHP